MPYFTRQINIITINNKIGFLDFAIECGMADQHEFYVCEIGEP